MSDEDKPEKPKPWSKRKASGKLTRKQSRLAQARVAHPDDSLSQLAQRTAYADKTVVKRELDKPHVQDRMRALMAAHPQTCPEGLHKKLVEGLNAKEVKFFAHEGVVQDKRVTVDHSTRHRYLETAGDWAGLSEKRIRIIEDERPPLTLEIAAKVLAVLHVATEPPEVPPA